MSSLRPSRYQQRYDRQGLWALAVSIVLVSVAAYQVLLEPEESQLTQTEKTQLKRSWDYVFEPQERQPASSSEPVLLEE